MRKLIIILFVLFSSFNTEKKYTVELTIQQWKEVVEVIDQSNASHQKVKSVQSWIIPQLNSQLDTTKNNK
jgi:hypothetical protein